MMEGRRICGKETKLSSGGKQPRCHFLALSLSDMCPFSPRTQTQSRDGSAWPAPPSRGCFPRHESMFDETEKPPAVPPTTAGAPVQTIDTSVCSDSKGSLSVRVSLRSRGVPLRAEPLQVQTPRCAPWLLGSLPLDCGKLMLVSLRQWDVASTSVASKAVFLLCNRGGRLIVPHLWPRNSFAAAALASRQFLVEAVESLALPAALSMGALARDRVL